MQFQRDILIDKDGREKLNKKREKTLIRKGLIKDPPKEDRDQSDYKNQQRKTKQ